MDRVCGRHVKNKKDFLGRTVAVFQPRACREITTEAAREIRQNLCGFFTVLTEWAHAEAEAEPVTCADYVPSPSVENAPCPDIGVMREVSGGLPLPGYPTGSVAT